VQATYANKEERAYELVLNKFDEMLGRLYHDHVALGSEGWCCTTCGRRRSGASSPLEELLGLRIVLGPRYPSSARLDDAWHRRHRRRIGAG